MLPVRTILQPTDGSESSDYAHRVARLIARDCAARLVVVQVRASFDDAKPGSSTDYLFPFRVPEDSESCLAELRRQLDETVGTGAEARAAIFLDEADTAEQILHMARELDSVLIVLGDDQRGEFRRGPLRTTAEAIMAQGECPVLVVRRPAHTISPRTNRNVGQPTGLVLAGIP